MECLTSARSYVSVRQKTKTKKQGVKKENSCGQSLTSTRVWAAKPRGQAALASAARRQTDFVRAVFIRVRLSSPPLAISVASFPSSGAFPRGVLAFRHTGDKAEFRK